LEHFVEESTELLVKLVPPKIPLGITIENFPLLRETEALPPDVILTPFKPEYEKSGRVVIVGGKQLTPKFPEAS
jgi:hypothetical protein